MAFMEAMKQRHKKSALTDFRSLNTKPNTPKMALPYTPEIQHSHWPSGLVQTDTNRSVYLNWALETSSGTEVDTT